ncbi:MAG: efflux RND transporter periplasmic adaptor subunit [Verrucomicrobiales bacterium]|nr:efflux RND transporter periplasmic adaptor subunit [Verrucomicrobiales bacterium]
MITCLVAVTAALLAGCRPSTPAPASASGPAPVVTVAHPIPRSVDEWDEFSGRLASPETVEVRARVSGHLDQVHFHEGSEVERGALLFTIDPRPYQAAVDQVRADLGAARARAELARGEARRAEGLAATRAISTDAFETRLKTAVQADEAVHSAEAALKAAELNLEFTEVRAPIAGRISNARVTAGNLVTGGNTASATLLTTLVSLDPLYCYFEVDEASALRYRRLYREGRRESALFKPAPAEMALGNEEGFPHRGVVDFVDNQVNPDTGTIRARAVFSNPDRLMAPGFFARVRVPGNGNYPAVLVRDAALASDQGRAYALTIGESETVTARPVKTGPLLEGLRVIREGLSETDRVVVAGAMAVRPGTRVTALLTNMVRTNVPASPAVRTGTNEASHAAPRAAR